MQIKGLIVEAYAPVLEPCPARGEEKGGRDPVPAVTLQGKQGSQTSTEYCVSWGS